MYTLIKGRNGENCGVTLQVGDVLYSIPFDEDNTDYQEYLKWLADGGVPTPADE